ncbi:MAG TPA: hypothetical protein VH352_07955, partial [Pseudonocardiaceae bacterium]|nr:hypothetical protein [Pseudonocardiaceae bacterium]
MRGVGIGGMVAVVALLAAACGGSTTPAATGTTTTTVAATTTAAPTTAAPTTTAAATSAPSTAAAVIKTASGPAGIWLTDQTGRTLYIFTKDVGSKSACNAGCESNWPPFTATGPVTVNGQFLSASLVG